MDEAGIAAIAVVSFGPIHRNRPRIGTDGDHAPGCGLLLRAAIR
jgi:hypothetical protein